MSDTGGEIRVNAGVHGGAPLITSSVTATPSAAGMVVRALCPYGSLGSSDSGLDAVSAG
ncbi:MAG: hypothetical protein LBH85_08730 [Treponema sp.]|nr:hypothetical protein [Treponema sp.]